MSNQTNKLNSTATKNERNVLIDSLKGLAIILVVVGHAVQNNISDFDNNIVAKIIYSFHMPLFFLLSGYIAYIGRDRNTKDVIINKLRTLLIPFLAWYFIVDYFIKNAHPGGSLLDYAKYLAKAPDWGLWFLWILFLCFIVLQILIVITKRLNLNSWKILALHLLAIILIQFIPTVYFGMEILKWNLPFFLAGYLIFEYKDILRRYLPQAIEISLVLFPILALIWSDNKVLDFPIKYKTRSFPEISNLLTLMFRYVWAFVGIIVSYSFIKKINFKPIVQLLVFLGTYTLEIYVLQHYLAFRIDLRNDQFFFGLLDVFLVTVTVIILSLLIMYFFVRASKVYRMLLLGRIN